MKTLEGRTRLKVLFRTIYIILLSDHFAFRDLLRIPRTINQGSLNEGAIVVVHSSRKRGQGCEAGDAGRAFLINDHGFHYHNHLHISRVEF